MREQQGRQPVQAILATQVSKHVVATIKNGRSDEQGGERVVLAKCGFLNGASSEVLPGRQGAGAVGRLGPGRFRRALRRLEQSLVVESGSYRCGVVWSGVVWCGVRAWSSWDVSPWTIGRMGSGVEHVGVPQWALQ